MLDAARKKKCWNKTDWRWWGEAEVSESTLKRFISGQSISPQNFKNLCEVVGDRKMAISG